MKLPVLDTYAFPVTIPSSNTTITIRPFLVKEEKLLLLAQESKDYQEQVEAIGQVIINCTNGAVNPKTAPYFDIEYLLIQLRARSVSEVITPVYICHNIINQETNEECGHKTSVSINLQTVKVSEFVTTVPVETIQLSPRYRLNLRYPTVYTIQRLLLHAMGNTPEEEAKSEEILNSIIDVFDTLEDKDTGQVYKFDDFKRTEKIDFLNSLLSRDYEKIIQFVNNMPTSYIETTYTCEQCKFEHTITLRGLSDFLA